jgi:hypothetical protein
MPARSTRAFALLATALVLLAACGDDGGEVATDDTDAPTTTVAPTTSTAAPTTTAPPATTAAPPSTVDPGDDAIPTDPRDYATAFIGAWAAGDQDSALVFGTQAAVDSIFAFESGGPGLWSVTTCEGAAGSTYCTFTAGGDPTVVVRVANEAAAQGRHQAVTEVQVSG